MNAESRWSSPRPLSESPWGKDTAPVQMPDIEARHLIRLHPTVLSPAAVSAHYEVLQNFPKSTGYPH
jgi:hypothetical protein